MLPLLTCCDKDESLLASMDDVAISGSVTGITQTSALISGSFDLDYLREGLSDENQEDILYISKRGVLCSSDFNFPDDDSTLEVRTDVENGGFSVAVDGLKPSTTYYYKTFLSVDFILCDENGNPIMFDDDQPLIMHYFYLYGNTRSFKTL